MSIHFPKFHSSDEALNITYQYRCELYQKHVKQTPAGCVITEFLPDVPWAGIYNTICCAAMHHFREGRWMAENRLLDQYAQFWCTEGEPRLYSFPIVDSVVKLAQVQGSYRTAEELYPKLAEIHRAWADHQLESGMYWQKCNRDGMEYSISGDGIRPTINSYLYADKLALGHLAERVGEHDAAARYRAEAENLREQINETLWNEEIGMYGVRSIEGVYQNVREQIGYIPWIYGIPTEGRDNCFRNLLDSACFLSPHGLRTADAAHPAYMGVIDHECLWNGPIWPFATAQTLTAVIEYLHAEDMPVLTKSEFLELLHSYAASHRDEDGSPYLDENMDPDTGEWLARKILRKWGRSDKDRGQHYNHSTFIDLVMTGICGIQPEDGNTLTLHPLGLGLAFFDVEGIQYHGHKLDIHWDQKTGMRAVVDDGRTITHPAEPDIFMNILL